MKETSFLRTIKSCAIKFGIIIYWTILMNHPTFVWYLWKFWWLRPIIIWYSSLTILIMYHQFFFLSTAVYCLLTIRGRTAASKARFRNFILSTLCAFIGFIHAVEVHGLQNLPKGGALVVYLHGPFSPLDICYLLSYVWLKMGRVIGGVIDANFDSNRFIGGILEIYRYSSSRETLIQDLKNGALRSVAPGGAYEAMFSKNSELEWKSRIGFAKIAKEVGVPVVPMFTVNLRYATPPFAFGQSDTMKEWYSLTKRPILIPKYYLPVKFHTYLGEPLYCGEDEKPEEFAQRVKKAIENLRDQHQSPQGSAWQALLERFTWKRARKSNKSE